MYVGVDGCRAGWFCVEISPDGRWATCVRPTMEAVWNTYSEQATAILVDIPIGLRESGARGRLCDLEARRVLGQVRASSVFPPPCRRAVYAGSYTDACDVNEELAGARLAQQTWGIVPKIREVDEFLRQNTPAQELIREIHPEVCFWSFAGRAMHYSKKTPEGFNERLAVLLSLYDRTEALVERALSHYLRKDVARDDILDALAAALTALEGRACMQSLPSDPERDACGLRMEMLFCRSASPAGR